MTQNPRESADERPEDAPPVTEQESFGTWLRRQREGRGIELRKIADSSKISLSYLKAFENNRFDVLPAPVFAKGFLRQYARFVGLDPEEVVNFYLTACHPEGDDDDADRPVQAPQRTSDRRLVVLAVTVAIVFALVIWLLSYLQANRRAGLSEGPSVESAPPPAAGPSEPPTATPDGNHTGGPDEDPSADVLETASLRAPAPAAERRETLRVALDFNGECWVEATVDGVREIAEQKVQGESLLLEGDDVVEFKIGDVNAVEVELNGVPFEIPPRPGTSVRTVRIDRETAAALGAPPAGGSAGLAAAGPGSEAD